MPEITFTDDEQREIARLVRSHLPTQHETTRDLMASLRANHPTDVERFDALVSRGLERVARMGLVLRDTLLALSEPASEYDECLTDTLLEAHDLLLIQYGVAVPYLEEKELLRALFGLTADEEEPSEVYSLRHEIVHAVLDPLAEGRRVGTCAGASASA
jgi:hypothetical protein